MGNEPKKWTGGDYRAYNKDKKYLHHYDLPEKDDLVVTIVNIENERLENKMKGTSEDKLVLYFKEDVKPLALNRRINPEAITKAVGTPMTDEWIGKRIALYRGHESRSDDGYAVRVREYAPKVEEAFCEDCGELITAHGNYSVNKIVTMTKAKYGAALCWDCARARKEAEDAKDQ